MSNDAGLSLNPVASFSGLPQTPALSRVKALPDSNYTFTQADSGCIFTLGAVTGARTHTLPAVAQCAGMRLRVIVGTAPAANTVTFQGPVGLMKGLLQTNAANDGSTVVFASVPAAGGRSVATTANTTVGSSIELVCDGVSWNASSNIGVGAAAGAQWAFA